jgi:hypothetical protein
LQVRSGQRHVKVTLEESGRVVGKVVGPEGEGIDAFALIIANYTEALESEASSPFASTGGEFVLTDVPKGRYAIALVADGFEPKLVEGVDVRPDGTADLGLLRLKRGALLRGRVVDAQGHGLGGAHVVSGSQIDADHGRLRTIMPSPDNGADPFMFSTSSEAEVFTDADGYFQIPNTHSRRSRFFVAAELAGVGRSDLIEVGKRGKSELRVTLQRAGEIHGRILGGGNDAVISALRRDGEMGKPNSPFLVSAVTNGSDFKLRLLTPGTYLLSAHSMDGTPDFENGTRVEVASGEIQKIVIALSTREVPPWDRAALEAYAEHVDTYCDCTSSSCRAAEDEAMDLISSSHENLTGPDFQTLTILDEKRVSCER